MTDKQQLDAELTAILPHLPGNWQLDPRYDNHCWCAVLIDGTGRGIHVNATQAKGRLYLSGCWPTDKQTRVHGPDKHLHITIARNRPPKRIAAEITRRFLPWYLAEYAKQTEQAKSTDAAQARRQELAVELAAILEKDEQTCRQLQSDPPHVYSHGVTVDVHGTDAVTIQLRYASARIAKAVLKAIVKAGGLND